MAKNKKKKKDKDKVNIEQVVGMSIEDMFQNVRLDTLRALQARVAEDDISYEAAVCEMISDVEGATTVAVERDVWVPKQDAEGEIHAVPQKPEKD